MPSAWSGMLYSLDRGLLRPSSSLRADRPNRAQPAELCGPQRAVRGAAAGAR